MEETPTRFLEAARSLAKTDCQCVFILRDGSLSMRDPAGKPGCGGYLCIWPSGQVTAVSPERPGRHTATEGRQGWVSRR